MSMIATQGTLASEGKPESLPYAPSWVDRLTDRVRALRWPPWLTYLLLGLALAAIETAVKWTDQTYPVGTLFFYHIAMATTGPTILTLLHYLDDWAADALAAFRPAMRIDDSEYRQLLYELTTLPRWPALAVTAVFGIVVTGGIALSSSAAQNA